MSLSVMFDNGTHKIETAGTLSADQQQFKITRLAFLNRFTDAEAVGIDLASAGATTEAASIRRIMSKINAATYIDLSRQDTIDGVNWLASLGLLDFDRASEILTSAITEVEIYKGAL
jgi:hypothetical protein